MKTTKRQSRTALLPFRHRFQEDALPISSDPDPLRAFGALLKAMREEASLTLRQLSGMSGVKHPIISAMEHGRRRCGPRAAEQLADSFFGPVQCANRKKFLYSAVSTLKPRGVTEDAQQFPPAILDCVAAELRGAGIRGDDIRDIYRPHETIDGHNHDLILLLKNGQKLAVNIKLTNLKK